MRLNRLGASERWYWSVDLDRNRNFLVWIILRDGLKVPTFDVHPDGDGKGRRAGLTEERWTTMFAEAGIWDAPQWLEPPAGSPDELHRYMRDAIPTYEIDDRRWQSACLGRWPPQLGPRSQRRVWRNLAPIRQQTESLHISLVDYPLLRAKKLERDRLVIGSTPAALTSEAFGDLVVALATGPPAYSESS